MITHPRLLFVVTVALALLLAPRAARATGAVIGVSTPTSVDVDLAVAVTPYGTTRWSRIHVQGPARTLWFVPARPGAAVDWADDAWLDALDDATAPRIAPPPDPPACATPRGIERVPTWGSRAPVGTASVVSIHTTPDDARAHATALGYTVPAATAQRISDAFVAGWNLVSIEISGPSGVATSSPTLRVSDEGVAALPLALTGETAIAVRVSAFVLAASSMHPPGTRDLDALDLKWSDTGSGYAAARADALDSTGGFVRESASHDVLFDGARTADGSLVAPIASAYFASGAACDAAATAAAASEGVVNRTCAPGAAATVPGGTACSETSGALDASAFACSDSIDLALALAGLAPKHAIVTRLSGIVTAGNFGGDEPLTADATTEGPAYVEGGYAVCPPSASSPSGPPPVDTPPATVTTSAAPHDGPRYVTVSDGCGGDTTTEVDDSDENDDTTSNDGCGGSSKTSDENDDTSSCSGDSKSSSDENDEKDKSSSDCTIVHRTPRHSPMSRIAIALLALILPLRRMRRRG